MNRRIRKEVETLKLDKTLHVVEYNNLKLTILLPFRNFNLLLKFTFDNCYPFSPPSLTINGDKEYSYIELLAQMHNAFKIFDPEICLCCNTILCKNKWGPMKNIKTIVDEVKDIFNTCQKEINNDLKKMILFKNLGYNMII